MQRSGAGRLGTGRSYRDGRGRFYTIGAPARGDEGPHQWCPGQPLSETDIVWDVNVCHTWYWVDYGFHANRGH